MFSQTLPPLAFRTLVEADLPAFVALRNASLARFPEAFTSDHASERDKPPQAFVSRLGEAESGHFVLGTFDAQGQLLGTIAMERDRDVRLQTRHLAHVTAVMVAQDAQRKGIAKQLVARCVAIARAIAILDQLLLTVTASNLHVVRLYEGAGFVRYGLLPRAILVQGQFFDKLLMRLDLAALRDNRPLCTE